MRDRKNNASGHGSRMFFWISLWSVILSFGCLIFTFGKVPVYLPFFGLNARIFVMGSLQFASLFFLIAFIQSYLELKWRIICMLFCFLTMAESWFIMMTKP